jgi:hypothetical protein
VVSKDAVAVGRKGSGRAWGSTSRNANTGKKSSQNVDRRAVGCNLVVLKMTCSQSGCKVQTHFSAPHPYEQLEVLSALVQRCDACHFILNQAVRNSTLALH